MIPLLSLLALILVIVGIVKLLHGEWVAAIVCFVLACAVGPGGWSVFR